MACFALRKYRYGHPKVPISSCKKVISQLSINQMVKEIAK